MKNPINVNIFSPKVLCLTIVLIIGSRLRVEAQDTLNNNTLDTTITHAHIGNISENLGLLFSGKSISLSKEVPDNSYHITRVFQGSNDITMMKKGHTYSYGPLIKGDTERFYVIEVNTKDSLVTFSCQGRVQGEDKVIYLKLGKHSISKAREATETLGFVREIYKDGNKALAYTTFKSAFGEKNNKVYDMFVIKGDIDAALEGLR